MGRYDKRPSKQSNVLTRRPGSTSALSFDTNKDKKKTKEPPKSTGVLIEKVKLCGISGIASLSYSMEVGTFGNLLSLPADEAGLVRTALRRQADHLATKTDELAFVTFEKVVADYTSHILPGTNGSMQLLVLLERNGFTFPDHLESIELITGLLEMIRKEIPKHDQIGETAITPLILFERSFHRIALVVTLFCGVGHHPPAEMHTDNRTCYHAVVYLRAFALLPMFAGMYSPCRIMRLAWLGHVHHIPESAIAQWSRQHWGQRTDDLCAFLLSNLVDADTMWQLVVHPALVQALPHKQLHMLLERHTQRGRQDDLLNLARAMREELFPEGIPDSDSDADLFVVEELTAGTFLSILNRFADAAFDRGYISGFFTERCYTPGSYRSINASILLGEFEPLTEVRPVKESVHSTAETEIRSANGFSMNGLLALIRQDLQIELGSGRFESVRARDLGRLIGSLDQVLEAVHRGDPEVLLEVWSRWAPPVNLALNALNSEELRTCKHVHPTTPGSVTEPIAAERPASGSAEIPSVAPVEEEPLPLEPAHVEPAVPEPEPESIAPPAPEPEPEPIVEVKAVVVVQTTPDISSEPAQPEPTLTLPGIEVIPYPNIPEPYRTRIVIAKRGIAEISGRTARKGLQAILESHIQVAGDLPRGQVAFEKTFKAFEVEVADMREAFGLSRTLS